MDWVLLGVVYFLGMVAGFAFRDFLSRERRRRARQNRVWDADRVIDLTAVRPNSV